MQSRYSLLQSGFISLENPKLVTDISGEEELEFDAYILNKPQKADSNKFFYHKGIQEIYEEFRKDERISLDFDFRERTLIEFFNAIKEETFASWLAIQNNSSNLSYLHYLFIEDTINYILTKNRTMTVDNWFIIIDKNNSFNKKPCPKFDFAKYFTINNDKCAYTEYDSPEYYTPVYYTADKLPVSLPNMVALWLDNKKVDKGTAFSDFVVTSAVIFGKQSINKTVF